MNEDQIKTLNTICHHRLLVQAALQSVIQKLERRSLIHDESKFREDEFEGFSRINASARQFPYGSDEYRASLKREGETIQRHFARNDHHPEYYNHPDFGNFAADPNGMGLLAVIEMVCDWWAAWKVYDGQRAPDKRSSWQENLEKQKLRFKEAGRLSEAQWWAVEQVAALLEHAR